MDRVGFIILLVCLLRVLLNLTWWVYFKFQKKAQEDGRFLPEFADAEEGNLSLFRVLLQEKNLLIIQRLY